jgi:hypothetical protein
MLLFSLCAVQENSCHTYDLIDYNHTALTKDFKLLNIFINVYSWTLRVTTWVVSHMKSKQKNKKDFVTTPVNQCDRITYHHHHQHRHTNVSVSTSQPININEHNTVKLQLYHSSLYLSVRLQVHSLHNSHKTHNDWCDICTNIKQLNILK